MDENAVRKIKPNSMESERAVLACMLMSKVAVTEVVDMLQPEDFYNPTYGAIYSMMEDMNKRGVAIDALTLTEELKSSGAPESTYSMETMQDIVGAEVTSVNATEYAGYVAERSRLRQIIRMTEEVANRCYTMEKDSKDLMEEMETDLLELMQKNHEAHQSASIRDVVNQVLLNVWEAAKNGGNVTGVPTGFYDLDDMLTGLHGSELILIAARPGVGKTAFALNIAQHVIMKTEYPVAIFNMEMNREQLVQRMLAMESHVNSQNIRTGNLQDEDWQKLYDSSNLLGETKLYIEDSSDLSIGDIRTQCRKLKQKHDIGLIIVDYLQLVKGTKNTDSRTQEVAEVSRGLKVLAMELNVPVIALSQLNRQVEARANHRPQLSDLRESGSIEQDADVVLFIERQTDKDNPELAAEDQNKAEIIVAKQRNGSTGTIRLGWQGEYTRYVNLERSGKRSK